MRKPRKPRSAKHAPRTRIEYGKHWVAYDTYCGARALERGNWASLLGYLKARVRRRSTIAEGTLNGIIFAVAAELRQAGVATIELPHKQPRFQEAWRGIRRKLEKRNIQPRERDALLVAQLRKICDSLSNTKLIDVRDRALLTVCFQGALPRSELVALDIEDLVFAKDRVVVNLARSKKGVSRHAVLDRGRGSKTCPVRSLEAWVDALQTFGISSGPLFRSVHRSGELIGADHVSGRLVARVLQDRAQAVGIDSSNLAAHSLRKGLAVEAANAGNSDTTIAKHGRWAAGVSRYTRPVRQSNEPDAVSQVGL